ncbi:MAG: hypothetical protein M3478_08545 [Planctomycetota bacterium]|nr:hypothetical protein [Planctomycetota bacterium]
MTTDAAVSTEVAKALRANGHVLHSATARDPRDLIAALTREAAPVVLVDLDPKPRELLDEIGRVAERFPATRFVAILSKVNDELLMAAMEAGVRRVLPKQSIGADLQGVLNRLTSGSANRGPQGQLITIFSAGGGCGATTIAANLANEIGQDGRPALLVDLDLTYGSLAVYFGLEPHYALDHVLGYGQIDVDLIRSTASVISPRVHLMASTASTSFARPEPVDLSRMGTVLREARHAYTHTIVDAPRVSHDVAAALTEQSTHALLVFQLTVKNIRLARSVLQAMEEHGVPRDRIIPVANRCARGMTVSKDDAAKVLGLDVRTLRNDYAAAIEGFNFGKPLAEAAPRSVLRKDLQELMARLSPVAATY